MKRIKPGPGRRLALNKETLRTLGDADLQGAAGGLPLTVSILTPPISTIVLSTIILTQTNPPEPDPEPEPEPEPKTEGP